jgi:hypothetical protein
LEDGRGIQNLRGLANPVARVCFSEKGRLLAAYGHGGQVAVWDVPEGRLFHVFNAPPLASADNAGLAFVGEGRLACCGSEQAIVWDMETGHTADSWALKLGGTNRLAVDPEGRLLLFRAERVKDDEEPVACQLRELVPGGQPREIGATPPFARLVWDAAVADRGRVFLASGRHDIVGKPRRTVFAMAARDGEILWSLPSTRDWPDFDYLYPVPESAVVAVSCEPEKGEQRQRWLLRDAHTGALCGGSITNVVAVGPGARQWLCWPDDPHRGLELWVEGRTGPVVNVAGDGISSFFPQFSPDGTLAAWGNTNGSVTVCDLERIHGRLMELGLGW